MLFRKRFQDFELGIIAQYTLIWTLELCSLKFQLLVIRHVIVKANDRLDVIIALESCLFKFDKHEGENAFSQNLIATLLKLQVLNFSHLNTVNFQPHVLYVKASCSILKFCISLIIIKCSQIFGTF